MAGRRVGWRGRSPRAKQLGTATSHVAPKTGYLASVADETGATCLICVTLTILAARMTPEMVKGPRIGNARTRELLGIEPPLYFHRRSDPGRENS